MRIGQKPDPDGRFLHAAPSRWTTARSIAKLEDGELDVVAGTAWLWARQEFAEALTRLFVDEAGQLSLANTLAVAGAAANLVLLGDPQQLAQPSQAAHPRVRVSRRSATSWASTTRCPTAPGIFLDRTYRMHPDLCRYTSEVFYDDRLGGVDGFEHQRISGTSRDDARTGLAFVEVDHQGNANASPEEAAEVVRLVRELIGSTWTDHERE